ncbi:MAG: L-rhamnose mutarotase [Verrucomicrobiota bacterium]
MKTLRWIALVLVCWSGSLMGFSPYEQHLRSGRENHVGLVAEVTDSKGFAEAVRGLGGKLASADIKGLQVFQRKIEGAELAVVYFAYPGDRNYLEAAAAFTEATSDVDWSKLVKAHPRAREGEVWMQMEWINFIRGVETERQATKSLMIGTSLRPEREFEYRTLHQTVWPGVVDAFSRTNGRNLSIFLIEFDGRLLKFLYTEYVGEDAAKDEAAAQADPVNQRWWKLTDACQKPFSDVKEGNWAELDRLR